MQPFLAAMKRSVSGARTRHPPPAGEELTFVLTVDSIKEPGAPPAVDPAVDADYVLPLGEPNPANPVVYFDITVGTGAIGRVEIELKNDVAPKTAENFRWPSARFSFCCTSLSLHWVFHPDEDGEGVSAK